MKTNAFFTALLLTLLSISVTAQHKEKEIQVGHIFHMAIPEYMERTVGLNAAASVQFISSENDVAGFVIEDSKEDLKLAETSFATLKDFYQFFEKDFLAGLEKRTLSPTNEFQKNGKNYLEFDAFFYDKELKTEIYYYVCLIEENNYYYKVLCWSTMDKKDKFKPDFKNIALSIHE